MASQEMSKEFWQEILNAAWQVSKTLRVREAINHVSITTPIPAIKMDFESAKSLVTTPDEAQGLHPLPTRSPPQRTPPPITLATYQNILKAPQCSW